MTYELPVLLRPCMIIHSTERKGPITIVLGQPQVYSGDAKVDWNKFVACCTASGIEVSKQTTISRKTEALGFRWRLMAAGVEPFMKAMQLYSRDFTPVGAPLPYKGEPITYPALGGVMEVYNVVEQPPFCTVVGQPISPAMWKEVLTRLLLDPAVSDISQVYSLVGRTLKFSWRVVWNTGKEPDVKPPVVEPPATPPEPPAPEPPEAAPVTQEKLEEFVGAPIPPTVPSPEMPVGKGVLAAAVAKVRAKSGPAQVPAPPGTAPQTKEEMDAVIREYRKDLGAVKGPDGKWHVPLDSSGRLSKVTLFNPAAARTGRTRVEEAVVDMLGRKPRG